MEDLKETKRAKINENVTHQGIGGKEIILEKVMPLGEALEIGNIAGVNFFNRRMDLVTKGMIKEDEIKEIEEGKYTLDEYNAKMDKFYDETKVYYGHVGNLGYFVCEDEIEML